MTTPDPRPVLKQEQIQERGRISQPTALEALRAYIKEWSKIDSSLKPYHYDEVIIDDVYGREL